jgi:hypothetical protein
MAIREPKLLTAIRCLLPVLLLIFLLPGTARADWQLWDWSANINGATYNPPALPGSVNDSGFDYNTGLGTMTFSFAGAGANYAGLYLYPFYQHSSGLDLSTAYGTAGVAAPAGLSWEMEWPGMPDGAGFTLFDYFAANALDNTNHVAAYSPPPTACCSVALAALHSFTLASNEIATLTFNVGNSAPTSGFYLQVTDHDATVNPSIYLTEQLNIRQTGSGGDVPEPSAMLLLATVSAGVLWRIRRRRA